MCGVFSGVNKDFPWPGLSCARLKTRSGWETRGSSRTGVFSQARGVSLWGSQAAAAYEVITRAPLWPISPRAHEGAVWCHAHPLIRRTCVIRELGGGGSGTGVGSSGKTVRLSQKAAAVAVFIFLSSGGRWSGVSDDRKGSYQIAREVNKVDEKRRVNGGGFSGDAKWMALEIESKHSVYRRRWWRFDSSLFSRKTCMGESCRRAILGVDCKHAHWLEKLLSGVS